MVIMTERFRLVKITDHALERLRERFNLPKKSYKRILKIALEKGEKVESEYNNRIMMEYEPYVLICALDNGYMVVLTVVNKHTRGKSDE